MLPHDGAQDIYLTGSPQITFFKTVYRRHTNFAVESIEQTFNGSVGFGKKVSTTISRNGDLITDVFLEITMKKTGAANTTAWPAEALIDSVELEIGGQRIDKHYADWFRIFDSLFRKADEREQYRRMTDWVDNEGANNVKRFYVPLIFFFSRQVGLALPLIARKSAGRKSTPPCASGHCARENRLDFQGGHTPRQVLVACC